MTSVGSVDIANAVGSNSKLEFCFCQFIASYFVCNTSTRLRNSRLSSKDRFLRVFLCCCKTRGKRLLHRLPALTYDFFNQCRIYLTYTQKDMDQSKRTLGLI